MLIIGGGASGLMAAAEAGKIGKKVCVLEKNDRPGKKLLMTGNGRCNFTNQYMSRACFRGANPDFAWNLVSEYPPEKMIFWMEDLGVRTKAEDGYCYPATGQASSVVDSLLLQAKQNGVEFYNQQMVTGIFSVKGGYQVVTESGRFETEKVLLSCGTSAGLKEKDNRKELISGLQLPFCPFVPALGKLLVKAPFLSTWKGVRFDGSVSVVADNEELAKSTGEIQLTEEGISGIPVFQVARFASVALKEKKKVTAKLNFLPSYTLEQLIKELERRIRRYPNLEVAECLIGLIHKKLILLFVRQAGMRDRTLAGEIGRKEIERLAEGMLSLSVLIYDTCPLSAAQAAAGGVDTDSVDPVTMESKLHRNLYLTGEILDIDGTCGGYNLHFAWMTAMAAIHGMWK